MAVGGPDDAARHFTAALELAARRGGVGGAASGAGHGEVDVVGLVRRATEALARGRSARPRAGPRARPPRRSAPADQPVADRVGPAPRLRCGRAAQRRARTPPTGETGEALALLGDEPSRERARALSLHARALYNARSTTSPHGWPARRWRWPGRFELLDVVSDATATLALHDGVLRRRPDRPPGARGVVEHAHGAGDVSGGDAADGSSPRSCTSSAAGWPEAHDSFARAAGIARRVGLPVGAVRLRGTLPAGDNVLPRRRVGRGPRGRVHHGTVPARLLRGPADLARAACASRSRLLARWSRTRRRAAALLGALRLVALNADSRGHRRRRCLRRPRHGAGGPRRCGGRAGTVVAPALPRAPPALRPDARPTWPLGGGPRARRRAWPLAERGAGWRGRRGHHGAHHEAASRRGSVPRAWPGSPGPAPSTSG